MQDRISLVTEVFPPVVGGSGALLANIYSRLSNARVTVLTPATGATIGPGDQFGMATLPAPIDGRKRGIRSLAEWRHHFRLARAIGAQDAAIVHCARPAPEGLAALLSTKGRRSKPYVVWVHGEEVAVAQTSREHSLVAAQVCKRASAVVANSRFSADLVKRWAAGGRIVVVHPGVDADRFTPAPRDGQPELEAAGPTLLSVGRLQRRKGFDSAIRAVGALKDRWPGIRYFIAGEGEERSALQGLVASERLEGRVVFLGAVKDDALPGLYRSCDIFLLPTRRDGADVEGFGIVFLEAAACGKPTIAGRDGGGPEAIEDGETGLLVDGGSLEELSSAITRLSESAPMRASMGDKGRSRVLRSFTWARAARQIDDLNRELRQPAAR